jgi:hypothetical protein
MSVGAKAETAGPSAAGAAEGDGQVVDPGNAAGRILGRLSVLPALLVVAWLLAGLPLLLTGLFTPAVMFAVSVPLAVVLAVFGMRWIPGRWQAAMPAVKPQQALTPWWAVVGVIAVAVAFGVDQMIYHSDFIIVTRDPGSYVQFAAWISHHGALPIPQDRAAFGGGHNGLSFQSPAFYQVGKSIVPQFMAGLPMALAAGFWIGGVGAAVAIAPVLGACAVLSFGGLVARLVGPRWAPLAAVVLALSLPEQFTSRATYSEPLAEILFLGGLCLVIDSLHADGIGARVIAAAGGLAIGLTLLVRIDGASDFLPVIPYCGMLFIGRRRQAAPLAGGFVLGASYGIIDAWVLSRPYMDSIRTSLVPLEWLTGIVVVATAVAVAALWRRGLPEVRGRWLPDAVTLLAVVVVIGFAIRPYLPKARVTPSALRKLALPSFQKADHLPIEPYTVYNGLTLHWVFWYIGVPAVVLGTLGAVLLARRCLRGRAPAWTLPLMVFAWGIVVTLYRPGIVPDHPWASRRLVPAVLPGFIVLAAWASSWLVGRIRQLGMGPAARGAAASCCAVALVLPTALTADGLAFKTTYRGEIAAVNHLCAAIPRNASVVFINGGGTGDSSRLTEVVRGMCGYPVGHIYQPTDQQEVEVVVRGIEQAGRRPVLLSDHRLQLQPYGGQIRQVMRLRSTQDVNTLTTPPKGTRPLELNVWMTEPTP